VRNPYINRKVQFVKLKKAPRQYEKMDNNPLFRGLHAQPLAESEGEVIEAERLSQWPLVEEIAALKLPS
jgi:hypothetical protein